MTKITNEVRKTFIRTKLASNYSWQVKALVTVYNNQTNDEQIAQSTKWSNGIGFTGSDAEILSSFAFQFLRRGSLSEKQMNFLKKKIVKYWRQVLQACDVEKLDGMILKEIK